VNAVVEKTADEQLASYRTFDIAPELAGDTYLTTGLSRPDASGKITYSNLIMFICKKQQLKNAAAPNPFTEKITVQFTSSYKGNAEIRIANIAE